MSAIQIKLLLLFIIVFVLSIILCRRSVFDFICPNDQGQYYVRCPAENVRFLFLWTGKGFRDRLKGKVYYRPSALQINPLNMKDILVFVCLSVFLWPYCYDKYQD